MPRDPLATFLFFLALQIAAGWKSAEQAAADVLEMQHELGRRVPVPVTPPA